MAKKSRLTTAQVIRNAGEIFHKVRWGFGIVVCPYCGSLHIKVYDGYKYKCNSCKRRFSDKTRTLLHGSKLSVAVWLQAIYEMFTDNFISSNVLAAKLGINQKSAWLMQTKIRYSMVQDRYLLEGIVAQDEMYVGGSLSNYHYSRKLDLLRKEKFIQGKDRHYSKQAIFTLNALLKQPVFGMNDGKNIVLSVTPNPLKKEYLWLLYKKHVKRGSITVSDESSLYHEWKNNTGCRIYTNNHHNNQYMTKEGYTSNRIENTFSWYKRGFNGKITHCKYHQYYLNEFVFRYNTRDLSTIERFNAAISNTIGMTITYKDIREYNPNSIFMSKKKVKEAEEKHQKHMAALKWILENTSATSITNHGRIYTLADFE